MKFIQVLKLLSKPKLLSKIKNSKSSDTGNPFVKSYKDLMAGGRPTADFYNAEMLNLFWETTPEAIATLLPPPVTQLQNLWWLRLLHTIPRLTSVFRTTNRLSS
jgi:hypothetical protein